MNELTNWMMVFLRVSAMLSIFPIFSSSNFPVQMRLALGALVAALVYPTLPSVAIPAMDIWGMVGLMAQEVLVGLMFGFTSRMVFFGLDMAGSLIGNEIGLSLPPSVNPMTGASSMAPGTILFYLASMLWLGMDLHHWMLVAFQRTYEFVGIGQAHLTSAMMQDVIHRTSLTFVIAVQLSAPLLAVSFIISMVFAVLGRTVPQLNVFQENITVRTLVGMGVFGVGMQLMSQHIMNYLRSLPEDILRVAHLLNTH
jgi:flagellar biosynthetic protein FliR